MPELLTAHHAVHFRLRRSLRNYVRSRSRPEPVVLGVDTPVEFETSFE